MANEQIPEQSPRLMPVLQSSLYLASIQKGGISVDEKIAFLTKYYETGNQSLAAKSIGRASTSIKYCVESDPAFATDFHTVKNAMKHNLEQTMYLNGLKEKGYMDRITWLRKNFPAEYNPSYVDKDNDPKEAIKELSSKLERYTMVPKKSIIDIKEGDSDASQNGK